MVLQNRLEYGFSGDQVPAMPQFPKFAKRKRSVRKKVDGYRMCAFDLLATVAGQLLSESENSTVSLDCNNATPKVLIKQERLSSKQTFKVEAFDQQSCSQTVSDPKQISDVLKEHSQASSLTDSGPASLLVKSNASDNAGGSMTLNDGAKTCYPSCDVVDRHGASRKPLAFAKVQEEIGLTRPLELEYKSLGNGLKLDAQKLYCLDYPIDLDTKQPALLSSDSSTEVPACRSYLPCNSSMHNHESCMEQIVYMDDDDNFSGCTHPSIITNRASSPQCLADHGVRKLPASKYWKAAPSTLKYGQFANYDLGRKTILRGKKLFYTRQRAYLKRRKLFERCSIVSDGGFFHEDISNLCEKNRIKIEAQNAHTTALEVHDDLSTKMEQSSSYDSVKLSIKSFKVPELFVEIPETATVGSLKRTVLEAVTAILQGGLRVGVILQGKKVRDDNKTLCQVGISRRDKLDNLGFILEPSQTQTSPPLTSVGGPCFSLVDNSIEPLARNPPTTLSRDQASDATPRPVLTSCPESDHDSVHSPINASSTAANKLALVALPHINAEALAVVPLHKPRRSENVQRRIRRPFTVAEVEALVRAVEKLGTGRWRDVKLRDFDSAKHRTYVDLKDKWKTLVHTARISPQQRRGEPVPQELLDRVLSAHAYWSQQQARLTKSPACSSDTKQLSLPCPS